jgi:hypothetical protein
MLIGNDKFERMWNEAVLGYFKIVTQDFPGRTEKTTTSDRIAGFRAENRIRDLSNTVQKFSTLDRDLILSVGNYLKNAYV